ncbi:MAG: hypothetical protein O9340_14675 [Cyclobacteriaceae bacterium]|jgi:hypothetical protein|nr:hypothetical protein [Cyclobacteriaceae bacterium]
MKTIRIILLSLITSYVLAQSSVSYKQEYEHGKQLYQQGKYALCMEVMQKVIPYDQANPYSTYASFYYALAAYKQNYFVVAKNMLVQIEKLNPQWSNIQEVYFWLGLCEFENKNPFEALKQFSKITKAQTKVEADVAIEHYLMQVKDAETLRMLFEDNQKNKAVASALIRLLWNQQTTETREEILKLSRQNQIDLPKEFANKNQIKEKDKLVVSALFPFVANTLDNSPSKKRNQFVLDLYNGMQLATDTLNKMGINIELRAYDTERNSDKIKAITALPEVNQSDVWIGPLLREENQALQEASIQYKVPIINPLSNDLTLVKGNDLGLLFEPDAASFGSKSAQFLKAQPLIHKKKSIVFYGPALRDSVMAWSFIQEAEKQGIKIIAKQLITRESVERITKMIATPTEYDEWKAPKQFTVPKDSIGAVFVASDDPIIYTKVVSTIEVRKDNTMIIGNESWLESGTVDIEKFQRMNIRLYAANYSDKNNEWNKAFIKSYVRKHGKAPIGLSTNYARIGYELMLIVGHKFKEGNSEWLSAFRGGTFTGFLLQNYDYSGLPANNKVTFLRFNEGELTKDSIF